MVVFGLNGEFPVSVIICLLFIYLYYLVFDFKMQLCGGVKNYLKHKVHIKKNETHEAER